MTRKPDFQKEEAKQSLWDNEGKRMTKRNKGKGRNKDKKLVQEQLEEESVDE